MSNPDPIRVLLVDDHAVVRSGLAAFLLAFDDLELAGEAGSGEEMLFATFSDRSGRFEAVFFPRVYRRFAREIFRARGPFHLRGRVESDLGAVSLTARGIELLGPGRP